MITAPPSAPAPREVPDRVSASAKGWARRTSRLAGAAVVAIGVLVLAGWWLDLPLLTHLLRDRISMKSITAFSFVCLGGSLVLVHLDHATSIWRRYVPAALAGLAATAGILTLIQSVTGRDLGIDQLLATEENYPVATIHPGRMAEAAAICFVLLGGSGLALALGRFGAWSRRACWTAAAISFFGLILHVYGHGSFTPWPTLTAMAVHTTVALWIASVGMLLARPGAGGTAILLSDSPGGESARRLLPWILGLPVLAGVLRVHGEARGWFDLPFGTALTMTVFIAVMIRLILTNARALMDGDRERYRHAVDLERVNAELRSVTIRLEESVEELKTFSYSVSHDLRAPLRAIDGFSRVLEEDAGDRLDAAGRGHLERIRAGCRTMGELIDGLLALARVSRADLVTESVDLTRTAEAVVDALRAADPGRQVDVAVAPGLRIDGDGRLLRAALGNLIGNAWKFSSKTTAPRIEIGAFAGPDGTPEYFVRDNGAGFDPAYADRLFGPFQRLHARAEFDGAGIGLASAARIIRRHGGRIRAEGHPGRGATFYFTIGAAPAPVPAEGAT